MRSGEREREREYGVPVRYKSLCIILTLVRHSRTHSSLLLLFSSLPLSLSLIFILFLAAGRRSFFEDLVLYTHLHCIYTAYYTLFVLGYL